MNVLSLKFFFECTDELVLPLHTTREFAYVTPAETSFSITWAVNTSVVSENTQFSDEIAIAYQKLPDGSTQGNLTFRADAEGNNTNILCVITNFINLFTYTFNYTIIIQGKVYALLSTQLFKLRTMIFYHFLSTYIILFI